MKLVISSGASQRIDCDNAQDMNDLMTKVEKTRFLSISAGRDVDSRNRNAT